MIARGRLGEGGEVGEGRFEEGMVEGAGMRGRATVRERRNKVIPRLEQAGTEARAGSCA